MKSVQWIENQQPPPSVVATLAEEGAMRNSTDVGLWYQAAHAWQRAGNLERAERAWRKLLERRSDRADAYFGLAQVLAGRSQDLEAIEHCHRVIQLEPQHVRARELGASCAFWLDEYSTAMELAQAALDIDSQSAAARNVIVESLRACSDSESALKWNWEGIESGCYNIESLALRSELLMAVGQSDECERFLELDQLLRVDSLFGSGPGELDESINQELGAFVRASVGAQFEPDSTATQRGLQTTLSCAMGNSAWQAFLVELRRRVDQYVQGLRSDHPWVRLLPERVELSIWSVILERGGYQEPHVHPSGWLSGVYYVQADTGRAPDTAAGAIEFGMFPDDKAGRGTAIQRQHQPTAGDLILFPSFLYHRTIPTASDRPRISIAFDIGAS